MPADPTGLYHPSARMTMQAGDLPLNGLVPCFRDHSVVLLVDNDDTGRDPEVGHAVVGILLAFLAMRNIKATVALLGVPWGIRYDWGAGRYFPLPHVVVYREMSRV